MYRKENAFTFFLTGKKDNDAAVENYVRNNGYDEAKRVHYKLEYIPPYQNFTGIAHFERLTQYRAFSDSVQKRAVAIIDLSEWIGHEKEEYLEIFCKFLHDYDWSFYRYEYVFTVGEANRDKTMELYALVSEYLCEGKMIEDRTMTEEKSMSEYLMTTYPVNKMLSSKLSRIFIRNEIKGYTQLNMVMNDLVERLQYKKNNLITEQQLWNSFDKLENSKLAIMFNSDMKKWREEYSEDLSKEVA